MCWVDRLSEQMLLLIGRYSKKKTTLFAICARDSDGTSVWLKS